MTEQEALTRITAQPPQSEKLNRADIVINTEGSFRASWRQIQDALNDTIRPAPMADARCTNGINLITESPSLPDLLGFWKDHAPSRSLKLYQALGLGMVLPILYDQGIVGMVLWAEHNFTATLQQVLTSANGPSNVEILSPLDRHVRLQQCELTLLPDDFAEGLQPPPVAWGFQHLTPDELTYPAWQEAARRAGASPSEPAWVKVLAQPFEQERENTP